MEPYRGARSYIRTGIYTVFAEGEIFLKRLIIYTVEHIYGFRRRRKFFEISDHISPFYVVF